MEEPGTYWGDRWTAAHELAFIRRLGTFAKTGRSRAELLEGYMAGLRRRARWTFDREDAEAVAEAYLLRERANGDS
ncbi:MAG: hypothetical protein HKO53_02790 [Gemmatimonadetes bacterium]|nr:hypothetical protein [Gemmatimonadota bacterium]